MTSTKKLLSSRIAVLTVVLAAILGVCALSFGSQQTAWAAGDPDGYTEVKSLTLPTEDGADLTVVGEDNQVAVTNNAEDTVECDLAVAYKGEDAVGKTTITDGIAKDKKVEITLDEGISCNDVDKVVLYKKASDPKPDPQPTKHTVTFDANGHGIAPEAQEVEDGKCATAPEEPTEAGFTFVGWFIDPAGAGDGFDFATPITEDTTLYADWVQDQPEPATYAIAIDKNIKNGSVKVNAETAKAGDTVTITATPDKGYKLVDDIAVVVDAEGNNVDVANVDGTLTFTMPASDVTVTASFAKEAAPEKHTITIKAENGKVETDVKKAEEGVVVTLTPKANDGYKFGSWKSDQVNIKDNKFTMPDEDVVIVANFVKKDAPVPEPKTFNIVISKTDAKTGEPLNDADFVLKDANGNEVDAWNTTNMQANAIKGLRQDTKYILSETKAPKGYSRERDININYVDGKVMIDQGKKAVELKTNDDGYATLNVKDMSGSGINANTTSPKTGDSAMPAIIGGIVIIAAAAVAFAAYRKNKANKQQ